MKIVDRTERFELRLSKREIGDLRSKSAQLGVSAADYLRLLIRCAVVDVKLENADTKK
jgi:uncharacterized protein YceH (UPF0502 family)